MPVCPRRYDEFDTDHQAAFFERGLLESVRLWEESLQPHVASPQFTDPRTLSDALATVRSTVPRCLALAASINHARTER